jgi:hypothetical protein
VRDVFDRAVDAAVAAGDHDGVGDLADPSELAERGGGLDLRHDPRPRPDDLTQADDVAGRRTKERPT